jgi:DNA-binding MarR family transcriptional regulator
MSDRDARKAPVPPAGGRDDRMRVPGAAFLLSQLGFHSATLWKERLAPLGVDPRQAMLLRHVAASAGQSQQALGRAMRIPASRMVALVDELERRGLLERRASPGDRRAHALFLTAAGEALLGEIMKVSAEHEAQFSAGLTQAERRRLIALLSKVAAEQGLATGVHPGAGEAQPGVGDARRGAGGARRGAGAGDVRPGTGAGA